MKATIITDAKKLKASIASIRTSGAKLDERIQVAAISVIDHADKHGDTTLADALVNAMPKSGRKLALVEYLLAFGKFEVITAKSADDKKAIEAGREAYLAGLGRVIDKGAVASSPLTGFLSD